MADLEDALSSWRIRTPSIRRLGEQVNEFSIAAVDLYNDHNEVASEVDNGNLEGQTALRLAKDADRVLQESRSMKPLNSFDELALQQFQLSLQTSRDYFSYVGDMLDYFGAEREDAISREKVATFIDGLFLPDITDPVASRSIPKFSVRNERYRGKAHRASIARYREAGPEQVERRRELLRRYTDWGSVNPAAVEEHAFEEILDTMIRGSLNAYAAAGVFSSEEAKRIKEFQDSIRKYEIAMRKSHLAGEFVRTVGEPVPEPLRQLLPRQRNGQLRFRADWSGDRFSYADGRNRSTEFRPSLPLISQDKKGKTIVFYGDAIVTSVHEIAHQYNWALSSNMPAGLDFDPRGLLFSTIGHTEGLAMLLEELVAVPYIKQNSTLLDMTDEDVEATLIKEPERTRGLRARLFFRTHYLSNPETAAAQTYADTRNPAHRIDMNFPQEKHSDLFFLHAYDVGQPEMKDVLREITAYESQRLGSAKAGEQYVNDHQGLIIRGLSTGSWSLGGVRTWMLKHYLPRMHKALEQSSLANESKSALP